MLRESLKRVISGWKDNSLEGQRTPPISGPTTLAMPHTAPMSPPYFPRLGST